MYEKVVPNDSSECCVDTYGWMYSYTYQWHDALFSDWDMAAGHHMAGLLKRREAEAAMFISKLA